MDTLFTMQSIYSTQRQVVAVSLSFNGKPHGTEQEKSVFDLRSTFTVLANYFIGLNSVDRCHPCYIKVTGQAILTKFFPSVPRGCVVLEVLAHTKITKDVVEKLRRLSAAGYRLALAGYQPRLYDMSPILDVVDLVKIDARHFAKQSMSEIVAGLKSRGIELLGDKIETEEDYNLASKLGFDLLQGYYLSRPEQVLGHRLKINKYMLKHVIDVFVDEKAGLEDVEQALAKDPIVLVAMLRMVTASPVHSQRPAASIADILHRIGRQGIYNWLNVIYHSYNSQRSVTYQVQPIVTGRMCELLAEIHKLDNPLTFYMVGVLSKVDDLLSISMQQLVDYLALREDIQRALLDRRGTKGQVLKKIELFDQGYYDDSAEEETLQEFNLFDTLQRHSYSWANQIGRRLNEVNQSSQRH